MLERKGADADIGVAKDLQEVFAVELAVDEDVWGHIHLRAGGCSRPDDVVVPLWRQLGQFEDVLYAMPCDARMADEDQARPRVRRCRERRVAGQLDAIADHHGGYLEP